MPALILLLAALLLGPVSAGRANDVGPGLPAPWGPRYEAAVAGVERRWPSWSAALARCGVPAEEIVAAVFPELVRFSALQNDLEVFSLGVLYVRQGARYADFSIGPFQMKPSFVERLEAEVMRWERGAPVLYRKWRHLLPAPERVSGQEARRQRVQRMSSGEWQVDYAACFYDAVVQRGLLAGADPGQRLTLLSSAYNAGFWLDREELLSRASVPRYSPDPLLAGRCRYYEVTAYFARNDLPRIAAGKSRRP